MRLRKGLFGLITMAMIVCFFVTAIAFRLPIILELYQTENEIMKKIEEQQKISYSLEEELLNYGSDAFVEKIAREQLGFVKSSEIVFIKVE